MTELDISYESTCYRKQDNRVAEEEEDAHVEVVGVGCYLIIYINQIRGGKRDEENLH